MIFIQKPSQIKITEHTAPKTPQNQPANHQNQNNYHHGTKLPKAHLARDEGLETWMEVHTPMPVQNVNIIQQGLIHLVKLQLRCRASFSAL